MSILTYSKGLPTPIEDLNAVGQTEFEMFLTALANVFRKTVIETVNHLLSNKEFDKTAWNSYLQQSYKINKRHANGVISLAKGKVDSAKECRQLHIKTIKGKIKSLEDWIKKAENKLRQAKKFYAKKKWMYSKTGCNFPLSCDLRNKRSNWQRLKFQLHHKKRKCYILKNKLEHLQEQVIRVKVSRSEVFIVGSKDEKLGNQICQWDGNTLRFRVPACLESKFGKYVTAQIGNFERNINRLPLQGAKTWHFYKKEDKWVVAVQFTASAITKISRSPIYGCIGIDLNPSSIGWAYVDQDGNLKHHGQIPLQMGLPSCQQEAQIVKACLQLILLAQSFSCPIVCEDLDFTDKKEQLKEKGRKYARMLSGWAYSKFYDLLGRICSNRGIDLIRVNPAYTSLMGLVKYARQYGLASDEAASLAIARRGMKLREKLPNSITAYLSMKLGKHVWSLWNQLNNIYKQSRITRHQVYSISNWGSLVKLKLDESGLGKQLR